MTRALPSVRSPHEAWRPFTGCGSTSLPRWVTELAGLKQAAPREVSSSSHLHIDALESRDVTVVRATLLNAGGLEPQPLEELTIRAYSSIFEQIVSPSDGQRRYPVRFWNFLPGIHDDMGDGRDRYMVFNAGRFNAFETWYGGLDAFDGSIATASAVGHEGRDLIIYALAVDAPGRPLDNPRQIKPYRYSSRFGPLPPCFARATILNGNTLLVGGTASIRGEDSVHVNDLLRQIDETFENLAALVIAATGQRETAPQDPTAALRRYRELRVYHPNPDDARPVRSRIATAMRGLARLEMLPADLCRSELLVEIEGVADLP